MTQAQPPCETLPWDSEFFGFPIGRVFGNDLTEEHVGPIDDWSHTNQTRCLYFLASADNQTSIRAAENHHFGLVDIRLTFATTLPPLRTLDPAQVASGTGIRPAEPADLAQLQVIARRAHVGTRFFTDRHFPRDKVEELYSTWIVQDYKGRAQRILVAVSNSNQPLGYVSCMLNFPSRVGQIGLIAVGEDASGKGLGTRLVLAACDWFAQQGMQEVTVVTQGNNRPAQRLYQRCGFFLRDLKLWYHKWYY